MLEFVFDFMVTFIPQKDYEICQSDTDSIYLACSAPSLGDVIKPELRDRFLREKDSWFPRSTTPAAAAYDKRKPGLFKIEHEGDSIISLCSKTYFVSGETDKLSTKGLSKRLNSLQLEDFQRVLTSGIPSGGINRGFRVRQNNIWTYTMRRDALTYFYPKRKVLDDGIQTLPLDY